MSVPNNRSSKFGILFLLRAKSATEIKILGPGEPVVSKIRNQYLMSILIKIPRDSGHLGEIKNKIAQAIHTVLKEKEFRSARIVVDVDPV